MRTASLALLVAATGCNWFFGLDKTNLLPGDATDAPPGHGQLTWWLATSNPSDEISFPSLDGATVQYGALDGELTDAGNGAGGFTINEPAGTPYRLVYMFPEEPFPHEIQWGITAALHLTVPRFGRLARTAPAANSGYSWTCGTSACFAADTALVAYTTGVWMQGNATYTSSNNTVTFLASSLVGLDGPTDQLDYTGSGDTFVLVHYPFAGFPDQQWRADTFAIGFRLAPMTSGTTVAESSALAFETSSFERTIYYQPRPLPPPIALNAALGGLYNSSTLLNEATGGFVPDLAMPTMTQPGNGGLPRSVFIPMDNVLDPIPTSCSHMQWPWNPTDMSPDEIRPPAVRYRQVTTRSIGGIQLASGFEQVSPAIRLGVCTPGGPPTNPISFDIGIAQIPTFGSTMLSGDSKNVMLTAHSFVPLEFDLADGRERNTSDCIATLYRMDTSKGLVAVRSVQVLAAAKNQPHFPADDFMEGVPYVFGIECRSGYPNAASGDYTVFSGFPQQTSLVFPGTFTVTLQ